MENRWILFTYLFFFATLNMMADQNIGTVSNQKIENSVVRDSISTLLELSSQYSYSDLSKAIEYSALAEELATQASLPLEHFRIYRTLAFMYENNNNLDSAIHYYHRTLDIASKEDNPQKLLLKSYTDLAIVYRRMANYALSRDYHLKAMKIAEETGNQVALENAYHGLGTTYRDVGDYERAIQYYLEAIQLTEKRGDKPNMVNTMQFLAITYAESSNTELALKTIEEAAAMAYSLKDTVLIGIVAFDYGKILNLTGDTETALQKFEESLTYFELMQHKPLIARSLLYIADVYTEQNNYEQAKIYFDKCLQYEPFISKKGRADLHSKLGYLHHSEGTINKAIEDYQKSLEIAEASGFKDFCQKSNLGLYQIFSEKGETDRALQYLEAYTEFRDTLLSEEKVKKIAELELKYDAEKTEKEIRDLKLQQSRFLIIGIIALFSCISFFLIYILYSAQKNNRALRKKNVEIEEKNIQLKESNEILQQFTYVAAHDLKEPLRNIGSFVNLLQRKFGGNFNAEANEYMDFVTKGVQRMNKLLSALLEYSTISIQGPNQELTNTKKVLNEVVDNLQYAIDSKKAVVEYDTYLPNIRMNHLHLTQIFQNLISNSLKYSDQNAQPHIRIASQITDSELRFEVVDNGKGIDQAHGNKIFNLFYQSEKDSQANGSDLGQNSGIGLTICKNIVDKYNGQIGFQSELQKGTVFYFAFPISMGA
ncbi:MAG: tetratricopeptide repeat protein [Chitinophagales bacterium]